MRTAIREFAGRGGTIYAECGGMMYLTQAIRNFNGASHEMVGLFPAEAVMRKPGLTLGYRTVELTQPCILGPAGVTARGHEFHYSTLAPEGPLTYACMLTDARGDSQGPDGLVVGNTLALYTHLHFPASPTSRLRWWRQLVGRQEGHPGAWEARDDRAGRTQDEDGTSQGLG